jgi:hypothetical protein
MAYNLKDVFYLDTSVTIAAATGSGGVGQLDLSAYIDPVARGRSKGTGLGIYKVHWNVMRSGDDSDPIDDAEVGEFSFGLLAGFGSGDLATGDANMTDTAFSNTNNLLISSGQFYGPRSQISNASNPMTWFPNIMVEPSIEVPYVVVRDNVCLCYQIHTQMTSATHLSVRLEVAQLSLDQATLNQLLRTQTV